MPKTKLVVLTLALLAVSAPAAFAADILFMPLADTTPHEHLELQVAYLHRPLNMPPGAGVILQNGYYGVTDRAELSWHSSFPVGTAPAIPPVQVNAQYKLLASSRPDRPTVSVGAYNLSGIGNRPYLTYAGVQPYGVISHNLNIPDQGKPDWDDPLVRGTFGYGTRAHGLFVGLLAVFDERVAAAANWHGGRWTLTVNFKVGHKKNIDLTPSIWNGAPAMKVAWHHDF